jgi:ribosomal protein S18 acetylase RimI-like enzyme
VQPPGSGHRRREDRAVIVRPLAAADQSWKLTTLERGWGATSVARLGELVDAAPLPGFVAVEGDVGVGLLTYVERSDGIEVATIQSLTPGRGVGRALMDATFDRAVAEGASRLWLITTNDNVRAIAFYRRWGMDLVRVIRDGVDASRRVKPSIPRIGSTGTPLRHELEFQRAVPRRPPSTIWA